MRLFCHFRGWAAGHRGFAQGLLGGASLDASAPPDHALEAEGRLGLHRVRSVKDVSPTVAALPALARLPVLMTKKWCSRTTFRTLRPHFGCRCREMAPDNQLTSIAGRQPRRGGPKRPRTRCRRHFESMVVVDPRKRQKSRSFPASAKNRARNSSATTHSSRDVG